MSQSVADLAFGTSVPAAEVPVSEPITNKKTTYMVPIVHNMGITQTFLLVSLVTVLLVIWSIGKSITYHELLETDRRTRWGLYVLNVVVILGGGLLIVTRCSE